MWVLAALAPLALVPRLLASFDPRAKIQLLAGLASWFAAALLAARAQPLAALLGAASVILIVKVALGETAARSNERIEALRLRRLARERADRVSMLSHEIRTPLALVKGASDLLAEGTPGPMTRHQKRFVETIRENTANVIALAEDMLTLAKIEAGLFDLRISSRVDIRAIASSVIGDLRTLHPDAKIALDCVGAPPRVFADRTLIKHALVNLVINAIRHADGTNVTVRVHGGDGAVVVEVSDDGRGMTDVQRDKLFTRFATGQPLRDGTGLGLVITREIIELHGGSIMVDTITRRGTTIMLTLPTGTEHTDE